jgi:DNA (cytosine-5)-methyltransferase 1
VIDAARFLPQSRPRLFILAIKTDIAVPASLIQREPSPAWHSNALRAAHDALPESLQWAWIWWALAEPKRMRRTLTELIEDEPGGVSWHTAAETKRLLSLMSKKNRDKVRQVQASGKLIVGTIYKRIRLDENDEKIQRAEVRFDQISGCLRTPSGGSSRQFVLVVHGKSIRSRLLSPREAARLMGVPDNLKLPQNYNEAYHLMGDGLAVPVVAWLEQHLLTPLAHAVHVQSLQAA